MVFVFIILIRIWASRFAGLRPLASGYPLHHLHGFASLAVSVVPLLSLSQTASPFLGAEK